MYILGELINGDKWCGGGGLLVHADREGQQPVFRHFVLLVPEIGIS
jgi:hypothetical protein